jgi:mRNA-degrading endonuclease RelE of RelBE toxin-antitoxin system
MLAGLEPATQDAVAVALLRLQADHSAVGRPLRGRLRGTWVMRVGSYRVLYTLEPDDSTSATIIVRAVLHRAHAYGG